MNLPARYHNTRPLARETEPDPSNGGTNNEKITSKSSKENCQWHKTFGEIFGSKSLLHSKEKAEASWQTDEYYMNLQFMCDRCETMCV